MNISYDQKLVDYMARKGYAAIVVETLSPCGCCADTCELYTRFAKQPEADRLRAKAIQVLAGPQGAPDTLLMSRGIEVDENVTLGLRSFFGAKDVKVKGIYAWRL